jgi:exodeoxyribonuclease V gamma subunit
MLDALLSARSKLYISWAGRHVRDNSEQPPSVLVSQLRDYLRQGWQGEGSAGLCASERGDLLLAQRTRQHPCSPSAAAISSRLRAVDLRARMVWRA